MRRPENSPGSPAQWPAVSTSFGAMTVPEQRNAGLPAMSMMMRTTAGWASPSSVPSVMKDGRPGFRRSLGTRSQLSRLTQAAARTGMTRRAFMVPRGWDGGCDCNAELAPRPERGVLAVGSRRLNPQNRSVERAARFMGLAADDSDAHECVRSTQAAAPGAREGTMGGAVADVLEAVPAL